MKRTERTDKIVKFKRHIQTVCEALEMVLALLVLAGIVLSMFSMLRNFEIFYLLFTQTEAFRQFLEQILMLVIGIEFLVMLCRPSSENVIDVLLFLVARHMIVGDTTPYQDFVSVISVALLCVVRRYMRVTKEGKEYAGSATDEDGEQKK